MEEVIEEFLISETEYPVKVMNYVYDSLQPFWLVRHEEIEIHYTRTGSGKYLIDGKLYDYKANSVIIILSNKKHKRSAVKDCLVQGICLLFSPSLLVNNPQLDAIMRMLEDDKIVQISGQDIAACIQLLEQINLEIYDKPYLWEDAIFASLLQFFILIIRSAQNPYLERTSAEALVKNITKYINITYTLPLTLDDISMRFNISKFYLSRIFHEYTGKGIHDYITELRIKMAMELLTASDFKIISISKKVGFDDLSTFNRNFKRYTGVTPSEFREKL